MIVVHHLEQSRSERILWLLEELGLPYEVKRYKRDRRSMLAPPELAAVHPLGKAPIVVDDGLVLVESGAIIDTLISRHDASGAFRPPPGTPEHVAYTTFLHFAEGSMMPPLLLRLIFRSFEERAPALARPLVRAMTGPVDKIFVGPTLKRILDWLEGELARHPWFAGSAFSGADIQMSFPLRMARQRGGLDARWPELIGFLDRIAARPARIAAMRRIGE